MEDLSLFARHVAGAMAARVPLPDILRAYLKDAEGGPLERAVAQMADEIEQGVSLAEAIERHPKAFPASFRRLVALGEQSHSLPGLMRQAADRMEESLKLYESYRRSAAYPLILLTLLFVLISFVTWKVTPTFQAIFDQLDAGYMVRINPARMMLVMDLILLVPILYLLGVVMGLRLWGLGQGRLTLQIPVIGPILRLAETTNFANNLSLLLENRVPLAEALGLMADASSNTYVQAAIRDFHRRYEAGESLRSMMENQPLFPPSMAVMIAAAEDQGELAQTLRHLGQFYQDRAMHGLAVLRELMEPVMLVLVGLLVALMAASLYLPLFNIPRMIR
jgi:type II secretory pathway component PulF